MADAPFASLNLERQKFPGYGRCIYCGSDGGRDGLRREHITPRALGGNAEILKASCTDCEKKTSHIDGALANSIFNELRIYEGIQSRRKTTTKTTHLPTTFILQNGERRVESLPVKSRPVTVAVPIFYLPGLLSGIDRPVNDELLTMHSLTHIPDAFKPPAEYGLPVQIAIQSQFDLRSFARALAKIAHCFTVLHHGLDAVDSLDLPALILGGPDRPFKYVGGTEQPVPAPTAGARHLVTMFTTERTGRMFVGAEIRLFAPFGAEGQPGTVGMPIYRIVSGVLK